MLVTAEEYSYLLKAHNERIQGNYEIARWMSYNAMLLSPFVKNKPHNVHAFAPFPWDVTPPKIAYTVTAYESAKLNEMLEIYKKKHSAS